MEVNESGIVTLNCIMAKQVCMDDPMCGPTLDIVDRVCGSEVGKCCSLGIVIRRGTPRLEEERGRCPEGNRTFNLNKLSRPLFWPALDYKSTF